MHFLPATGEECCVLFDAAQGAKAAATIARFISSADVLSSYLGLSLLGSGGCVERASSWLLLFWFVLPGGNLRSGFKSTEAVTQQAVVWPLGADSSRDQRPLL